jgi:hypothetical protein
MPQETNLNSFPYFDDFNKSNDFYKVLFKPSYPIQARELTTLQSILQNQVESFGNHFFKEGSIVIPGQTAFIQNYEAVKIEDTYNGIPLSTYLSDLVGAKIRGEVSGVVAEIKNFLNAQESEINTTTIYVNYIGTSTVDNSSIKFTDGENLIVDSEIVSNNQTLSNNSIFAKCISLNATAVGSAFFVDTGIYFIRGSFVNVTSETLILDQYNNLPSYRIGFNINEEIITSDDDESLNDNAQGFYNYAAPGADRLKISVSLTKKSLIDFNDQNFVEISVITDGVIKKFVKNTDYNLIRDYLASRTYDESGDYYVKPFDLNLKNSLNDYKGSGGIYDENATTESGSTPSDNLGIYQLSPGKAYVKGYDVELISPTFIDFEKPRTVNTLSNTGLSFKGSPYLKLNRVNNFPKVSIGNTFILSLRDSRIGVNTFSAAGDEIGVSRVYDFSINSNYNLSNSNVNEWNLPLYDYNFYSKITLNSHVSYPKSTYVKGSSSGAAGYLVDDVTNSKSLTILRSSGEFLNNENISFNEINSGTIGIAVTNYKDSDVKSVFGQVSTGVTFAADTILDVKKNFGLKSVSIGTSVGGISTASISGVELDLNRILSSGNIISYTNPGDTIETYARISGVGTNTFTISPITFVQGVCNTTLPIASTITVSDFNIRYSSVVKPGGENGDLVVELPKKNVANVDLSQTSLFVKKEITGLTVSLSQLVTPTADANFTYAPYSDDRYVLSYSDGTIQPLNSSMVTVDPTNFKFITIKGLSKSSDTNVKLLATLKKSLVSTKNKVLNKANVLNIVRSNNSASGIGTTTLGDGLTYNTVYGTRVQDSEISLGVPDALKVLGIFESDDSSEASLPTLTLSNFNGPNSNNTDLLIGESVRGTVSNSRSILIKKDPIDLSKIEIVYENNLPFINGEVVEFVDSGVNAVVTLVTNGDKNITTYYDFDNGQRGSFLDYSRVIRKRNFDSPSRSIKIVFQNYSFNSTDNGDLITTNSYSNYDFGYEIPKFNDQRNSDYLDLRSRVDNYSPSSTYSPFDFNQRNFSTTSSQVQNVIGKGEKFNLSISYFLPRIDKLFLDKSGIFQLKLGQPSENPVSPSSVDGSLEIAEIELPAYLYNINDATVRLQKYKKYTMKDIANIDNRLKNVEYYTSLSLLEQSVANLSILDSSGLSKFKSGFFVDNFTTRFIQQQLDSIKNSIDISNNELRPSHYTTNLDLLLGSSSLIGIGAAADPSVDLNYATDLQDPNIKKTGDLVHLSFTDVEYLKQQFATESTKVTNFKVDHWQGSVTLSPSSEVWIDQKSLKIKNSEVQKIYNISITNSVNQIGFSEGIWKDWEYNWQNNEKDLINNNFRDVVPLMRSRNIEFVSRDLKPYTKMYAFFDNVDVTNYCIPKLLQISMSSGSFSEGEIVIGGIDGPDANYIKFRVARSNHKFGPYNSPTQTYDESPYTKGSTIPSSYTTTSNLLNIDTYSLCNNSIGKFYGKVSVGMKLKGLTSGAEATVRNVELISDEFGDLLGSFFVPDPNAISTPTFESGFKTFRLTSSDVNSKVKSLVSTSSDKIFESIGVLNSDILSTRSLDYRRENFIDFNNFITSQKSSSIKNINSTLTANNITISKQLSQIGFDPFAQTFQVIDDSGIFATKIDLYFNTFDTTETRPVTLQIRRCEYGIPTKEIIPFSEVQIYPANISASTTASSATTVTFESPVYLEGGREYAIVLYSQSDTYSVWTSTLGQADVASGAIVTQQITNGVLYKPQNALIWSPSSQQDLKFTLYRANFVTTTGTINFYNPDLERGNNQIPILRSNPLSFYSKRVTIGIGTTVDSSILYPGVTVKQSNNPNASGNIISIGASATGTLIINSAGIGYTPSSSSYTFTDLNLSSLTGNGYGARANLTITNGVAVAATISFGGYGYSVGDVVGFSSVGDDGLGSGSKFTVGFTTGNNSIILDGVQGEFNTIGINTLTYINSFGTESLVGFGVSIAQITNDLLYDGKTIKVLHDNHGMYSSNNFVNIIDISPDKSPTTLTSDYDSTSTSDISIANSVIFQNFENVGVSTTNPGYALIGSEIISYTGTTATTLTGISRGVDSTQLANYSSGTYVYKYEINGVSLRRINKTFSGVGTYIPNDIDSYYIKVGMGTNGEDRSVDSSGKPILGFLNSKYAGGDSVKATQNIVFSSITPNIQYLSPKDTQVTATVRTISATSPSGSEPSFSDNGFDFISPNKINDFNTLRMVASKQNESNNLVAIPGSKSFNMRLSLTSNDSRVSPVVDLHRASCTFTSNRINQPVTDFINDTSITTLQDDPHSAQYITKLIELQSSANSLKVLFDLNSNSYSDIRVMYTVTNEILDKMQLNYRLFPGYENLDSNGNVIDSTQSNGKSDSLVLFDDDNNTFKEVEYTISNVPDFLAFSIKIIISGTNSANVPIIKNFRTIALRE